MGKATNDSLSGISTNLAMLIAAFTVLSGYTQGKPAGSMLIDGVVVFAVAQLVLEVGYLVIVGIVRTLQERRAAEDRENTAEDIH